MIVLDKFNITGDSRNLIFACKIAHVDRMGKGLFRGKRFDADILQMAVTDIRHKCDSELFTYKGGNSVLVGGLADDPGPDPVTAEKCPGLLAQTGCAVIGEDRIMIECFRFDPFSVRELMPGGHDDNHVLTKNRDKAYRHFGGITCPENDIILSALETVNIFGAQTLGKSESPQM